MDYTVKTTAGTHENTEIGDIVFIPMFFNETKFYRIAIVRDKFIRGSYHQLKGISYRDGNDDRELDAFYWELSPERVENNEKGEI